MRQLVRRVSWVRASVDATSRDDPEEEDRVPDVVEGVDADAFARLQTDGFKTCGELTDGGTCSPG